MFTGIVAGRSEVVGVETGATARTLRVRLEPELARGLILGASVAIDGVCLTVSELDGSVARFDVIGETLQRTTLAALEVGHWVNVERSARFGDEIGGHVVGGHVVGAARIERVVVDEDSRSLLIEVPRAWSKYILHKGFIAIDGCSLTVDLRGAEAGKCAVSDDSSGSWYFAVHLIPETLRRTGLGSKSAGDRVNVELDAASVAIVDSVERLLAERFLHAAEEDPNL